MQISLWVDIVPQICIYLHLYLRISSFIFTKYQTEPWQAGLPTDTSLCLRFQIFTSTFSILLPPEVIVTSNSVQATAKGNCLILTLCNHTQFWMLDYPRNKIHLRKVILAFWGEFIREAIKHDFENFVHNDIPPETITFKIWQNNGVRKSKSAIFRRLWWNYCCNNLISNFDITWYFQGWCSPSWELLL